MKTSGNVHTTPFVVIYHVSSGGGNFLEFTFDNIVTIYFPSPENCIPVYTYNLHRRCRNIILRDFPHLRDEGAVAVVVAQLVRGRGAETLLRDHRVHES